MAWRWGPSPNGRMSPSGLSHMAATRNSLLGPKETDSTDPGTRLGWDDG